MNRLQTPISLTLFCLASITTTASAYPVHRRFAQAEYGKAPRCEMCHTRGGGSRRNSFGEAWQSAGESIKAFRVIAADDADGDGHSNNAEITKGSNPGDPKSTPDKPGRRYKRRQRLPIPREQLVLVFPSVTGMEALEKTLTPEQVRKIEQRAKTELTPEAHYPTLYFGVVDGRRVAVGLFSHFLVAGERFSILVGIGTDGKTRKVAMFRAGNDTTDAYADYLRCLAGRPADAIPDPGQSGCPILAGKKRAQRAIAAAVRGALWSVRTLFAKGAS